MKKLPDISQTLRWRQCQARTLRSSGNTESSWTSSVSISVYIFCVDTLPKVRRKESTVELHYSRIHYSRKLHYSRQFAGDRGFLFYKNPK